MARLSFYLFIRAVTLPINGLLLNIKPVVFAYVHRK